MYKYGVIRKTGNIKRQTSQIKSAMDELISWSSGNRINANTRKTKGMVFGSLASNRPINSTLVI